MVARKAGSKALPCHNVNGVTKFLKLIWCRIIIVVGIRIN